MGTQSPQGGERMTIYRKIRDIVSIGGIEPEYEECCQTMLQAGYEYMEFNKHFIIADINKACLKAVHDDCSGAQLNSVVGHLAWIHKNGVDAWIAEATKRGQLL